MKKQKRIPLKYGSARVDEDCSQNTIDMLNKMCELAYEMPTKQLKQPDVIKSVCDVCGSDDITEAPHMGKNCNRCHPL